MKPKKKTVVVGASPNPSRYAYLAVESLRDKGHDTVAVGLRDGRIADVNIETNKPDIDDVDTVTLYVGPQNQENWKDYIRNLNPKRVIFNPGAENYPFEKELAENGVEVERACTLVMLNSNQY